MDVLSCLSQGSSLRAMDIRRLLWIKRNEALRSWIVEHKSASILIEGNSKTAPSTYTSVLSFLCAEMAHLFDHWLNLCIREVLKDLSNQH